MLLHRKTDFFFPQSIFSHFCRNEWVKVSRMNSGRKPTYYCIQVSAAPGYKYFCISFCWVLYFFMNMHIGEKTSICSLLADSITFLSCASLWSFREKWSFTLHTDVKERRSWWIANKYNLYGQIVPEVISPHFTLQIEWFLPSAHELREENHPAGLCSRFSPLPWRNRDFLGGSDSKESSYNAGDPGLIPGLGRCPGQGNGNPLQYSCLENSMDRGAWRATVHGVVKSQTWLSN